MDLLLLGVGALVLVGITLWIVWPARTADLVGPTVRNEEVSRTPMNEPVNTGLPPQGDRFEDQYTSATADLSAGAVAASLEAMLETPDPTPEAPPVGYTAPVPPAVPATSLAEPTTTETLGPPRRIGLGAGAVLLVSGGVGGAWLYARWQRERNKPINRLRRGARDVASRLGERIPDVDELPRGAAPMSGAATALLLSALVASRALRHDSDDATQEVRERATQLLRESVQEATQRGRDAAKRAQKESKPLQARGRKESRRLQARLEDASLPSGSDARKPAVMGIGIGGIALIAGGSFVVWKLLRRGQPDGPTWYAGE